MNEETISRRELFHQVGAATLAATAAASAAEADTENTIVQEKPGEALHSPNVHRTMVRLKEGDTDLECLLAQPKGDSPRGSVIVIHEIFGLTDHIKDMACRFALAGYNALAPNLFTREGNPPSAAGGFGPVMEFVGKIPDSRLMKDLEVCMAWLRSQSSSNGKVGVTGYCWGGRLSMLLDAHAPALNCAVAYYGRITGQKTPNQPASPLDLVSSMHAPLMGHFGGKDGGIPVADVEKLRESLKEHHKTGEIFIYPDAGHAFNNDTREMYVEDAAHLAMQRTLEWFHHYLG